MSDLRQAVQAALDLFDIIVEAKSFWTLRGAAQVRDSLRAALADATPTLPDVPLKFTAVMQVDDAAPVRKMRMQDIETVREVFWKVFHKSGELWFDYLGDDEECERSTKSQWDDFAVELARRWGVEIEDAAAIRARKENRDE